MCLRSCSIYHSNQYIKQNLANSELTCICVGGGGGGGTFEKSFYFLFALWKLNNNKIRLEVNL